MNIVATGFVADTADVASDYPSAGRNSSDIGFQAIYWRCITSFLFSAVINAPHCRVMIFSNVTPPRVDGIDLSAVFDHLGIVTVKLPLTYRLPDAKKWGNVFYFLDILKALSRYQNDLGGFALFDSDVILAGSVLPLMEKIQKAGMVGYRVDSPADEDVNGLSMTQAARLAERFSHFTQPQAIRHLGGELLGLEMTRRADVLSCFETMWDGMTLKRFGLDAIRTEEHFWSIAAAAYGWAVADANDQIKRIWTARNYRTVADGDQDLPIWHLPAEKRYGFVDMFHWIVSRKFDTTISPLEFHQVVSRIFGIPHPSIGKKVKDLARGIGHKASGFF